MHQHVARGDHRRGDEPRKEQGRDENRDQRSKSIEILHMAVMMCVAHGPSSPPSQDLTISGRFPASF